eukprot:c7845_g1_i6.p2 GENE.c7845_g1_i6~~c7845_g1_i6.p2  ORF type:complete len:136 (-),score=35.60 c7845_g1_i6:44-451(-)
MERSFRNLFAFGCLRSGFEHSGSWCPLPSRTSIVSPYFQMYCWTPLDLAKYRMSDVKKPGKTDSRIIDLLKNTNDTLRRILRENRLFYEEAIVSYRQVQWSTFLMGHRNNIHGHVSLLNTDVLEIILRKLVNQLF